MHTPTLETERLILKTTTKAHAPFLNKMMNTPQYLQFIGDRNIRSDRDAENYIEERMMPQLKNHGHTNFIIFEKASDLPIGLCGLYIRDGLPTPDLGFALLPEYQKKGLAMEASLKLLDFGFNELKLKTILAITQPENTASRTLLERLDFEESETITLPGEDTPVVKYMRQLPM